MDNELIDPQFPHRRSSALEDVTIATFLDVAVVRCLFMPRWSEEGVHWALQFLFYRSVTAGHPHVAIQLIWSLEQVARDQRRNAFQMSSAQKKQFPAGAQDRSVALLGRQNERFAQRRILPVGRRNFIRHQFSVFGQVAFVADETEEANVNSSLCVTEAASPSPTPSERTFKEDCNPPGVNKRRPYKMADLKAFVESRLLSRSEKALEKVCSRRIV